MVLIAVSLIYTTSFAGSMFAGLMNVWITDRIGFGWVSVAPLMTPSTPRGDPPEPCIVMPADLGANPRPCPSAHSAAR